MAENFERFTEGARNVFALAQEEALRFKHNYLGTEHLLLGLVREGDGIASHVLAGLGVQLSTMRTALQLIVGNGDGLVTGKPGLTPRARKVIELAIDEAQRLHSPDIGTEHLLLGLVREGEGIAAGMLVSAGVSLDSVRQAVLRAISPSSTDEPQAQPITVPSPAGSESIRVFPGHAVCTFTMEQAMYDQLAALSAQLQRPLRDLIREAISRTWLGDAGGTSASPAD